MGYKLGFIEKCAEYGIDPGALLKEAARADYLRKAVGQLEDVVTRAQSKQLPATQLQDVDALSGLLARVKDKLGIEYAPTLRPTYHGGPHAWQVNPYPLTASGAPPRMQPSELENLLASTRGAKADVDAIRKQWLRKLVDSGAYQKDMNAALDASRTADKAFVNAVKTRKSVERAAQAAKDIRAEMPRIKALDSLLTKQAMIYQHDPGYFGAWRQRTGYQPQGLFGRLGGVLGFRPQEFYRSPEYFRYKSTLPKNWDRMRGITGPSFHEMSRTGPISTYGGRKILGSGNPFGNGDMPMMGGISGSNDPLSM